LSGIRIVEAATGLSGPLRLRYGTPRDPEYLGSITMSDVSFTFAANNVPYSISADLEPSGNKIVLKSFQVRNLQKLGPVGEARVSGSLIIKNYQIDSIDFTAFGQILLMSEATRKIRSTVYGSLFTEIGPEGLTLSGPIAHPYLSGNLYVRDANLTFPPVREIPGSSSQMALNYVVLRHIESRPPNRETVKVLFWKRRAASVEPHGRGPRSWKRIPRSPSL